MAARIVDRQEKTRLIVRAAALVFAEKGYQNATIDEIAVRASIGKGTVYQYFKSKQDLFFAVFDDYIRSFETAARHRVDQPAATAAVRLREAVHTVLEMSMESRELFPLVFEFWSASALPDRQERISTLFRDMYARFRELLAELIREGQHAGEFDAGVDAPRIAAVLVGALDGLFLQAWFDPTLNPVSMGDYFLTILLRGLAAPKDARLISARRPATRKGDDKK